MKKVLFLYLVLIGLSFQNSSVFSQNTYEILFTGEESADAYGNILSLEDGSAFVPVGQMMAGATFPNTVEHYLYKISPYGDTTEWHFTKQDTLLGTYEILHDTLNNLITHGIGWHIVGGEILDWFFWIASITTDFEINWFKTYHFAPEKYSQHLSARLLKLKNNEYIHSGISEKQSPHDWMRHIFRFNNEGDSLQLKLFPHMSGGMEIDALTYSPDSVDIFVHLRRFVSSEIKSANGDRIDFDSFDSLSFFNYPEHYSTPIFRFSPPYSAITYPDNTIIAAGNYYFKIYNNTVSYHALGAFKFDNDFNILKEQHLAVSDPDIQVRATTFNTIDYYDPGQIYVSGTFGEYGWGLFETNNWVYLAKLDGNFDLVWEKYLGGDAYYINEGMEACIDGGVMLSGLRYDENINNPNESDAYVWKLNSDGLVNIKEKSSLQIKQAIVFPNPSIDNRLYVRTALKNTTFVLYDGKGMELLRKKIVEKQSAIPVTTLPKGEYIWSLIQKNTIVEDGKWIKQ